MLERKFQFFKQNYYFIILLRKTFFQFHFILFTSIGSWLSMFNDQILSIDLWNMYT